jgi:hypothetical protein
VETVLEHIFVFIKILNDIKTLLFQNGSIILYIFEDQIPDTGKSEFITSHSRCNTFIFCSNWQFGCTILVLPIDILYCILCLSKHL